MVVLVGACTDERPTEPSRGAERASTSVNSTGVFRDDFSDVDGTPLQSHAPDGGGEAFAWVLPSIWGVDAFIRDSAIGAIGPDSWAYVTSVHTGEWAELAVNVFQDVDAAGTDQDIAIFLRTVEANNNDGVTVLWSLGPGVNSVTVDASNQSIPRVDLPGPVSQGVHTFRAEISSSNEIQVRVDGAVVLTAGLAVSLPPAKTGIGFFVNGPPSASITSFLAGSNTSQAVNVLCSPNNPMRGDSIQCKTSLAVPDSYTVVRRTATGAGFVVEDLTTSTHQPGDTNTWAGIAVAPTGVQVEVQVGLAQNLINQTPAHFGVQTRSWPTWQLATLFGPTRAVVASQNMVDFPVLNTNLGLFQPDYPSAASLPLSRHSGGPNGGLVYLRDPVGVTGYLVYTHPALYPPIPGTPLGSKQWYKDQDGKGALTPTPPYCSQAAQIATLAANVERHEGVTKADSSHYGVANQQFALLQPQSILEEMYSTASDTTFRIQVDSALVIFNNTGPYAAAQQNFDAQDTGPTLASAGCTFDFNPNDN